MLTLTIENSENIISTIADVFLWPIFTMATTENTSTSRLHDGLIFASKDMLK